ncbi:MAG: SUMF1/EgtB/PvdO family nonheme iron enzyme [Chloroflexi bacterium]|nr:SUMF1/EgtB/PvdO family nonheme iron enzyme [Chloroflexota bacterium]
MTNRPLRVFPCHSSKDKTAVRELYKKLRLEDWIDPWLDEEKLLPGQDWHMEIEKAVEVTDVVVVLLSNQSVSQEGYVQRELKLALDVADEKPEGAIFIVPLRLDECPAPRRLKGWHYVDYFPADRKDWAVGRLVASLKTRADTLGLQVLTTVNDTPIDMLGLSEQVLSSLKRTGITNVEDVLDLLEKGDTAVMSIRNVSTESLAELRQKVQEKGYILKGRVFNPTKDSLPKESSQAFSLTTESASTQPTQGSAAKLIANIQSGVVEIAPPGVAANLAKSMQAKISHSKTSSNENKLVFSNDMEFMLVPAGKFLMGDKNEQHTVDIPYDYWMARFPVTNEQYNIYVKAKGISHPVSGWDKKKDHPVVNVNWSTVMEYCRWLNDMLKAELPSGLVLRLPSEAEWEKAARGTDGREYPWGNSFDKNKCNSSEGGKGGTTSVGSYSPQGDSPYGCADMSGNVWEWTHSEYKAYPYNAKDWREYEQKSADRILRGGSFGFESGYARCAYRVGVGPDFRFRYYGFRVVVSPVLPS